MRMPETVLVAVRVKVYVPAVVGVPVMLPRARPSGRAPAVSDKVGPGVPVMTTASA
jgi:hypothetical protein